MKKWKHNKNYCEQPKGDVNPLKWLAFQSNLNKEDHL